MGVSIANSDYEYLVMTDLSKWLYKSCIFLKAKQADINLTMLRRLV